MADFSSSGLLRENREFLVAIRPKQHLVRRDKAHRPVLRRKGSLIDDGVGYQENIARLGMDGSEILDRGLTVALKLHPFAGEKVVIAHIPC